MISFIKLPAESLRRMWARTYLHTFRTTFFNRRYQQLETICSGRVAFEILGKEAKCGKSLKA
jgi:hypothetical protein